MEEGIEQRLSTFTGTFGTYLEDIRRRVYQVAIVFAAVFGIGFFSAGFFIKYFIYYLSVPGVTLTATSPFQLIDLAMSLGLLAAAVVTVPLLLFHLYAFLYSALVPGERRLFLRLIPIAVLLFAIGFAYGFAVMYYAVEVIAQVNVSLGIVNLWDISRFLSQIALTAMLLGILFEFPLVLTFLIRAGFLSVDFLISKRRHAIVVILILVALLPPTDGLSFIVMSVPLIGIYELTIWSNRGKRHSIKK